jgi:hypothetical protein
MCFKNEENIDHLLVESQFIKVVRQYIHDVGQNHRSISTRYRSGEVGKWGLPLNVEQI